MAFQIEKIAPHKDDSHVRVYALREDWEAMLLILKTFVEWAGEHLRSYVAYEVSDVVPLIEHIEKTLVAKDGPNSLTNLNFCILTHLFTEFGRDYLRYDRKTGVLQSSRKCPIDEAHFRSLWEDCQKAQTIMNKIVHPLPRVSPTGPPKLH
ncbi:MAG: hypothetical protein AAF720_02545 [Pseudomonadota bacterium]